MAVENGSPTPHVDSVLQELAQSPYRFKFLQAMRLLEAAFADRPRWGQAVRVKDDAVRFGQIASLKFAPSSVANFELGDAENPHELSVYFFGLMGPNGALPLHLTEYVRDRQKHHDDTALSAFLNLFHHRFLTLYYRAWADAQPAVHFDRENCDRFSVYVRSIAGLGTPALAHRDAFPDLSKQYYVGHLSCPNRHADGLQSMLADFFGIPVFIEEFVGAWLEIPEDYQFRIGEDPSVSSLGEMSTLGDQVWDCQHKFRIRIGPLNWSDYRRLLPGGDGLKRLTAVVRNYVGDELSWDMQLILKSDAVPAFELGEMELGLSTWLDHPKSGADAEDLCVQSTNLGEVP